MAPLISLSVASLLPLASASLLYTTHYSGQVATLNLQKTSSGSYDLKVTSNITACGAWPSWLTYSADQKVLYCSDESFRLNGSLTTFDVATDGALTQTAKIVTMGGGVNSLIYNGGKNLAIAH